MNYIFGERTIKIPDAEIENNMKILELTKEEAIQTWLEDEGYLDNEEQNELDKKAKKNRITATIHSAKAETPKKKTQKERVKKENPTKEMIIAEIAKIIPSFGENMQILNPSKLISFTIGTETYEIDLKQKRKKKE